MVTRYLSSVGVSLSQGLWCLRTVCFAGLALYQSTVGHAQTAPPNVTYLDTSLTQCPGERNAEYFYYYSDTAAYRASSWCGAAQKDIDVANATDPYEWRKPYQLDSCTAGVNWYYSHLLQDGTRWHSAAYRGINMVCATIKEVDHTAAPQSGCSNPGKGNPIYPLLGTKREEVQTGIGIGKLRLSLVYDSVAAAPMAYGGVRAAVAKPQVVGSLWSSTLHRRVLIEVGAKGALVARGDGRTVSFKGNGAGVYTAEADISDKLLSVTGGYRYIDAAGQALESYDSAGNLAAIHWAGGESLALTYSTAATAGIAPAAGYLVQAHDSYGRSIGFAYQLPTGADPATRGLLAKVTDTEGQAMNLGYDSTGNLTGLTWADGKSRIFHYQNANFAQGLTGITDELGVRYATFGYDSEGRAISTEHVGGAGSFSASYSTPPQVVVSEVYDSAAQVLYRYHDWAAAEGTAVTTPQGQSLAMSSTTINGKSYLTSQSQPAGSGCAASASAMSYDANGNLASRDDFNGNRSCYASDLARNLQTTKVEGLANTASCGSVTPVNASLPAGSRKTTTDWHPDWPLVVRVAEPGRLTTNVYNGQPDPTAANAIASCAPSTALLPDGKPIAVLCKQVEQASTDTSGSLGFSATLQTGVAARTWQWTYNQAGQILTETDGNSGATSRAYYTDTSFGGPDPYFENVTLLLRGIGTDGSTTIVDESPTGKILTARGNAQISTAQGYVGGSSLKLDGNGDYVDTASGLGDFAMGTGDFTIEFFALKSANGLNNYDNALSTYSTSNGSDGYWVELSSSRGFYFAGTAGSGASSVVYAQYNSSPNDSAWHHWAVSRSGTSLKLFKDGAVVAEATNSVALPAANLKVGSDRYNEHFNGYLHMRVTKGVARYTANFTPPTQFPLVGLTSTSTGHRVGDLQGIMNAAGHTTQFNLYDPAGRVLQTTDPRGVVTDITYTPRGWVSTVTTTPPGGSARTTTYTYDGVGQVTGVAQPDGTSLAYTYDAAHRLVGVTDARGNTVSYTLDNEGNRVAEEVRDPTGVLQRSIGRSFDALNRLQQVTGAPR